MCIALYAQGKTSINKITKTLGMCWSLVQRWIKETAESLEEYTLKLWQAFKITHLLDYLLEKLATEVARGLMDKFSIIDEVHVKVSKTKATIDSIIDFLGCKIVLKREIVYLALGSSLGDRRLYLNQAVDYLRKVRGINVLKVSEFVESEPYGEVATKNKFLNGAVKIATYLEPEELLDNTMSIEKTLGRIRSGIWGEDRTCDIDIIFFGDKKIRTERLTIPHYDWQNRDFVKIPLKNINPFFDF